MKGASKIHKKIDLGHSTEVEFVSHNSRSMVHSSKHVERIYGHQGFEVTDLRSCQMWSVSGKVLALYLH